MSRQRLIDYGILVGATVAASACFFMVWYVAPALVEIIRYGSWYDYFGFVVVACFGFLGLMGVFAAEESLSRTRVAKKEAGLRCESVKGLEHEHH